MAIIGKVGIINLALGNLFTGTQVQSVQEISPENEQAQLHYDVALGAVLSDYPWGFAMREKRLPVIPGGGGVRWQNAFAYPADCVKIDRLYTATGLPLAYEIGGAPGGVKAVFAHSPEAYAWYVSREVTVADMTDQFVDAFAWRLAAAMASGMLQDPELAAMAAQMYAAQLETAKARDAREGAARPPRPSEWMEVRHG